MELNNIKNLIRELNILVDNQKAKLAIAENEIKAVCEKYFLEHSNVKVGSIIYNECINYRGDTKKNYYKVSKIEANVDGTISIYGNKRKIDKEYGKREVCITNSSIYDTSLPEDYKLIENESV